MQDTKKPEKYVVMQPVFDSHADDPDVMAAIRESTIIQWRERVASEGGTVVTEPTVRSDANVMYGQRVFIGDEPLLDDDGEQIIDHTKEFLMVTGLVMRP